MATTNPIVTEVQGYVNENNEALLAKSILGAKSASLFNLQSGVKGPTALHIMDTTVVFGDGSACGWDETEGTEFTNRILTPAPLKVNMAFCDKNLLKTWAQHKVKVAAGEKDMPFAEEWTSQIVSSTKAGIEKMLYQGDSSNGNEFDGLIKILGGESDVVAVSSAKGTDAYAFLKDVAAAIPAQVKVPAILVSTPLYREFMQSLVAANLFHYDPKNGENEYMLPGSDIKVIAVDGLNGAASYEYAIAADLSNIHYGVDLEGDEDKFDLWYSKDNREFRLAIEFIAGVQVGFPSEIVLGKRAR